MSAIFTERSNVSARLKMYLIIVQRWHNIHSKTGKYAYVTEAFIQNRYIVMGKHITQDLYKNMNFPDVFEFIFTLSILSKDAYDFSVNSLFNF